MFLFIEMRTDRNLERHKQLADMLLLCFLWFGMFRSLMEHEKYLY